MISSATPCSRQPSFTWSKISGVGTVNSSGVYGAGGTAGASVIKVASGTVSTTASATVIDAAPTIATRATAGATTVTGTTVNLSALGADDGGEPSLTYAWSLTSQPNGSTLTYSANGNHAARNTTATFKQPGSYTFLVTINDGHATVTSSVNVVVVPQLSSITVTPGSSGINLHQSKQFSADALDQFAAPLSAQPTFTWNISAGVGSIDGTGKFNSAGAAGSATVTASVGTVSGNATMTVTNAAPSVSTAAAASNQNPITVNLSALGTDDGGESGLTYSWTATSKPAGSAPSFSATGSNSAKNTLVTFNKAGNYTFQVTISDGSLTTTSSVTVSVAQSLTSLHVTPGSANVTLNQSANFSATGYDQFGNSMTSQPAVTWSKLTGAGSIGQNGSFSSATAGSATIQAAAGGITDTATVTINAGSLKSASNLSGLVLTSSQVQLAWTDNAGTETGFKIGAPPTARITPLYPQCPPTPRHLPIPA